MPGPGSRSSMSAPQRWHRIWRSTSVIARFYNITHVLPALVLAAGRSSRMGRAKASLPLGGDTFLSRIVRTFLAAGVDDVVVVVGHDAAAIVQAFPNELPVRFVENRDDDRLLRNEAPPQTAEQIRASARANLRY